MHCNIYESICFKPVYDDRYYYQILQSDNSVSDLHTISWSEGNQKAGTFVPSDLQKFSSFQSV